MANGYSIIVCFSYRAVRDGPGPVKPFKRRIQRMKTSLLFETLKYAFLTEFEE